jgi:hypothetical protein
VSTDEDAMAAALGGVSGVRAAAVDTDREGALHAVRLSLAPGADQHTVADAAHRLLRERFGADADVAVEVVDDLEVPEPRSPRPAILRSDVVMTGFEFAITVMLTAANRAGTGDARAAATSTGMLRGTAQATLRAVEHLTGDEVRLELEHVEVVTTGAPRTALVAVTLLSAKGAERLTGTATVREDEGRAVIRATLDALNRRLGALLQEPPATGAN